MVRFIPPKLQRGRTVHSAGLTGLGLVSLTQWLNSDRRQVDCILWVVGG